MTKEAPGPFESKADAAVREPSASELADWFTQDLTETREERRAQSLRLSQPPPAGDANASEAESPAQPPVVRPDEKGLIGCSREDPRVTYCVAGGEEPYVGAPEPEDAAFFDEGNEESSDDLVPPVEPFDDDELLAIVNPGTRARRVHLARLMAVLIGVALIILLFGYLLRDGPVSTATPRTKIVAVQPGPELPGGLHRPPPPPVVDSKATQKAPAPDARAARANRWYSPSFTPLHATEAELEEEARLRGVPRGQAVARFPDLPRDMLTTFAGK